MQYTITNKNITFITEASPLPYTFIINQSNHETITVTTNRGTYTSTFTAYYGDTWTASVVADDGYNVGTLSATSGTITGDTSVSVGEATVASNTYVFYDSSGNVVSASVGSSPYYYSKNGGAKQRVGGTIYYIVNKAGTNDKYYVYYPTLDTTTRSWGSTGSNLGTSEDIGTGKSNTTLMINAGYTASTQIAGYIQSLNSASTNGCSDWFIGSYSEVKALRDANLVYSWFNSYTLWTSSEYDSDFVWRWYHNGSNFSLDRKDAYRLVVAVRAF